WGKGLNEMQVRQAGLDPQNSMVELAVELATELIEFPRHLSQHVGGYVLTQDRLDTYVPIGNAAMDDRTFIEWDKDDVDALNMMNPYLRRRKMKPEDIEYPYPKGGNKDELRNVLHKTLGVPLFQEQAMRIAIEAAGFSSEEANGLRRAMATFRNVGTIGNFEEKMIGNMIRRGYDPQFAKNCFEQIKGFGSYGFPESHAASFAQLVYISSWLKHYHPDAF